LIPLRFDHNDLVLKSEPPILLTGAAGFIGFHVAERLLAQGLCVDGVDALIGAADPALQQARWERLQRYPGFRAIQLDLGDRAGLHALLHERGYARIVHLAARAGVRDSVREPQLFLEANLRGFLNLLEAVAVYPPQHMVYASSSSVYGEVGGRPSREDEAADQPVSFYAATKRANELMAHSWASLYRVPMTGLRFFTVYGPWGRPEMAIYRFVEAIEAGKQITLYNGGEMHRDFTYVDDAVDAVIATLDLPPQGTTPARILNVGGGRPIRVLDLVHEIEAVTGRHARIRMEVGPAGDVSHTEADSRALRALTGLTPRVSVEEGLARFVAWYRARQTQNAARPQDVASGVEELRVQSPS
jgi:UDP-glucuronate 4-epimerase